MYFDKAVLEVSGLTKNELALVSTLLAAEPNYNSSSSSSVTRTSEELISAAFILGVINATPAVIKAITELFTDIRRNRYFTVKLSMENGETTVEGAATPERISQLATALKELKKAK